MISMEDILNIIVKVRKELGYYYKNIPKIISVRHDEQENRLYILCGDRPDKAVLMGPGGRVLFELTRRLSVDLIVVRTYTDLLVREERMVQAIRKAKRIAEKCKSKKISKYIWNRLIPLAEEELADLLRRKIRKRNVIDVKTIVAYSGGIDSSATIVYAKNLGGEVIPVTVDPGPFIIPRRLKEKIISFTNNNDLKAFFIKPSNDFKEIIENSMDGRYAPCKRCHNIIVETTYRAAGKFQSEIVFFGDLLPTGSHSIKIENELLHVNLPAYLALSKSDTIIISKLNGYNVGKLKYGCPLFRAVVRRNKHLKLAAYQRVLRETRAGVLEPNQALKLIRSIEKL
ncbi:MAG: hypothetical protein NDF53_02925 [archaeon GB-1867-097]|nr:hypothetical protein [Candidatus Culexmicrobium thermophilum]MCS7384668.1 hypothetical protein [Candidatus Culexmicrobium thermophilum]HDO20609.1 hypothetical protein [Candidatus Bathyarchaeota archaeon]